MAFDEGLFLRPNISHCRLDGWCWRAGNAAELKRLIDGKLPREVFTIARGPKQPKRLFAFGEAKMVSAHPTRRQYFKPVVPILLGDARDLTGHRNLKNVPSPIGIPCNSVRYLAGL